MAYTRINWKDTPSTDTLVNAENLNHMDKGIYNLDNVTKYITATATTNGDFYVPLGITPYTGMIVNVSFPTATISTDNARLSIDGGTTYYNTDTIASEIENKKVAFTYNGTSFDFIGSISGSNSNGYYTKYSDGTMICTCKLTRVLSNGISWSGMYIGDVLNIPFALTFTQLYSCNVNIYSAWNMWTMTSNYPTNSGTNSFFIIGPEQFTNANVDFHVIAIGKWK